MDFGDEQMGDIPTRPMRVKILYTFDHDNKTNCLARIPDVLNIPAVAIDENSQVGVIELKQCLQAIVAASPELISRLSDGDFTIYAYDYSEDETPLVGQGMLSAALSSATPTQQNKTMITGRVCKNMMALFNNGVKETLEVKLRLVPVPKPSQHDFTKNTESFRSLTPAVSGGFDPNAWSASMQQTKSNQQMNDYFNFEALPSGGDGDMALVDDIFGLASVSSGSGSGQQLPGGMGIAETPTEANFGFNPAFAAHSHSAPGSRAGSPMIGPESSTRNDMLRHQSFSGNIRNFGADQSRPASRASVASEVQQPPHQRQASTSSIAQQLSGQQPNEAFYNEDGQSRKRAKVTQTDWRGRSSFGSKSSDLRVTAATTASMHMHRPIAKRPVAPGSNLEPPPRVPTPVPQVNPAFSQQQYQQPARRSLLRQASTADSDFLSDAETYSDAIISSPEEDSPGNSATAEGTPQEIPSSPPVFPSINQTQPSSPGLPTLPLPRIADSGYMSERGLTSGNFNENFDDDADRSPDAEDYEIAAQYRSRGRQSEPLVKIEGSSTDQPPYLNDALLRGKGEESQGPRKRKPTTSKRGRTDRPSPLPASEVPATANVISIAPAPSEPRQSRRGSLALPPNPLGASSNPSETVASQRPAPKKRQSLHRSRTTSNDSEAGSPAPSDTEGGRSRKSGAGPPRREVIERRLQDSIENGVMPMFCFHCGAIETPTWRKIYVKECDGRPSPLDSVEGEGEKVAVEIIEEDEKPVEPPRFVIRKTMRRFKDSQVGIGFEERNLCNPCGLWFNKFRNMRPPTKWNRKYSTRKSRRAQDGEIGMSTDGFEPPSDAFFTDRIGPEDVIDDAKMHGSQFDGATVKPMPPPGQRPRANSMQAQQRRNSDGQGEWNASQLDAALTRAVQSSPVQFQGSQESPIEIELTPQPTRRLLFPSPRREGEVKSLDDNGQVSLKSTPAAAKGLQDKLTLSPKAGMDINFGHTDTNVFEAFSFDKENMAPPLDDDDGLAHLFEGSPSALFKTPRKIPSKNASTPRSLRQLSGLLKTPTPGRIKRIPLSPNANAANNADMNAATAPSPGRYFLRSTPSRLERTPGRQSNTRNTPNEISPFSRHLAQMLSEANSHHFTSPSRDPFDFSDLPTFTTPGRNVLEGCDWEGLDGMLSSEFANFDGGHVSSEGAAGVDEAV